MAADCFGDAVEWQQVNHINLIKKQRSAKITQWNELDSNYTGYQKSKIKKQRSAKITQWNELDSNYTGYQKSKTINQPESKFGVTRSRFANL